MTTPRRIHTLCPDSFADALATLGRSDSALADWQARYGTPRPWWRPAGYRTLVRIIIEQQVSLASARAVFDRLDRTGALSDPICLLALSETDLRAAGLSRQKQTYLRALATELAAGTLDLDALGSLPDDAARQRLLAVSGIGPWTADVYLLMGLRRADAWPASDLGLLVAMQRLRQLPTRPSAAQAGSLATRWQPYRSAACWMLWHGYLTQLGLPQP